MVQPWRVLLRDALTETDTDRAPAKIARAEAAIYRLLEQMKLTTMRNAEQRALGRALISLDSLKKRQLPGW